MRQQAFIRLKSGIDHAKKKTTHLKSFFLQKATFQKIFWTITLDCNIGHTEVGSYIIESKFGTRHAKKDGTFNLMFFLEENIFSW